jgi:hypothetical protein
MWFDWDWQGRKWMHENPNRDDVVLVKVQQETDAEADKRRLDWLDAIYTEARYEQQHLLFQSTYEGNAMRDYCDSKKRPPRPTLTILAAPDGWTLEQVAPEIREKFEIVDGRGK